MKLQIVSYLSDPIDRLHVDVAGSLTGQGLTKELIDHKCVAPVQPPDSVVLYLPRSGVELGPRQSLLDAQAEPEDVVEIHRRITVALVIRRYDGEEQTREAGLYADMTGKQLVERLQQSELAGTEPGLSVHLRLQRDDLRIDPAQGLSDAGVRSGDIIEANERRGDDQAPAYLVLPDGRRVGIYGKEVWIGHKGRSVAPDIDLGPFDPQRYVSKRHARIVQGSGQWFLEPSVKAVNPTCLNGKPLATGEPARLADGDKIEAAGVVLKFDLPGERG